MTEISAGRESPVSENKDAPIASAPSSLSNAQKVLLDNDHNLNVLVLCFVCSADFLNQNLG